MEGFSRYYDKRSNEWIDVDLFNEEDREIIRNQFDAEFPGVINELDALFNECWQTFSEDHPDIEKPPYCPVLLDEAWGVCVHSRDEKKAVILVNAKIVTEHDDPENAKDIIYHELCHLIYKHDHNREFWDELDKYDHIFKKQKQEAIENNQKEFQELLEEI